MCSALHGVDHCSHDARHGKQQRREGPHNSSQRNARKLVRCVFAGGSGEGGVEVVVHSSSLQKISKRSWAHSSTNACFSSSVMVSHSPSSSPRSLWVSISASRHEKALAPLSQQKVSFITVL